MYGEYNVVQQLEMNQIENKNQEIGYHIVDIYEEGKEQVSQLQYQFILFEMSSEEEEVSNQEEEEDEEEEEEEEENEDDDQDEDDEDDEDGDDQDDEDQGQDQDQDQDEDQEGDQDGEEQESKQEESKKQIPSFGRPVMVETEEFKFRNLLADISSMSTSIDSFISTLPSRGGSQYRSYQPKTEYIPTRMTFPEPQPEPQPAKKQYIIMKDQDIQVSMQPQIVVQQTLVPRQQPKKQPYRISNESTKFLAQLYEENKKLKRWQNTQMGSQSQSNTGFYKSKEKFERPEHERGLINLDDRNKEIDEAIQMLRRQDN